MVKNPPANTGDRRDARLIPGSGRSPGGGHGNPLQYSCLENSMDREVWRSIVHRVAESDTTEATCTAQHTTHTVAPPFLPTTEKLISSNIKVPC